MSKVKINSGLLALMIIASLFVGWQTMLIVTVLLFAFFDVDEKVKNIAIKVVTFYIGLTILSTAWGLIVDGVDVVFGSIDKIVATINSYLEYPHTIDIEKLQSYLLTPISNVVKIADNIVSYLFVLVKLGFVLSLLTNKKQKDNVITNKINNYVNTALNFINNFEVPVQSAAQTPVAATPTENAFSASGQVNSEQTNQNMNM